MDDPTWLLWARELQAMAQTGLTFSHDPYDRARYERLRQIGAEIMARGSGVPVAQIQACFQHEVGYPTPKVDVRGAAFRDGRVLMVREISDGGWTLPGGWADVNQSAKECVEREIHEESGFQAHATKLAAVWDYRRHGHVYSHPYYIYKLFFICELTGGAPRPSIETSEVAFFELSALPPLSRGRITEAQIVRMAEHARAPDLPTDFD